MSPSGGSVDTGTGYGRPRPTTMRELTEVGAGTPMGPILFEAGNFLHAS
jgi:hypothetical protein